MLFKDKIVTNRLKLPPFGKILSVYQEQKVRLEFPIYIHIGKRCKDYCFTDVRYGSIASYLPDEEDVTQYTWPIHDQHVIVMNHGDIDALSLRKIAFHLKNFKPRLIYVWSNDHPCSFY